MAVQIKCSLLYHSARKHVIKRRFPPPWSVEEQAACFVVRDANGQAPMSISRMSRAG
jgi:hypothetical protein